MRSAIATLPHLINATIDSECISELVIIDNEEQSLSARATITATNTINSGTTASYNAGTTVSLKAGFSVNLGATFNAFIGGCDSSSGKSLNTQEVALSVSSIDEVSLTENVFVDDTISVYPNPTNGICTIFSNEVLDSYSVFNIYGSLINTQKINAVETSINLQNLTSGMYVLKIKSISGKITTKEIIKK